MPARVVNSRLRLLLLLVLLVFAGLGARTAWLQTVRASSLAARAQTQAKTELKLPATRGTIFDRLGTPLAIGEPATDVIADPMQISDPRGEAQIAARVLGIPVRPLYKALADRTRGFVYVERKAPPARASALQKRGLTGFTFESDERRVYPQGTVAAPVLGYAGIDNTGLAGLEYELNKELSGRPGRETVVRDALGQVIDTTQARPARQGRDVFLTLDSTIQANAEQVLQSTVRAWHAKDATAIVLDPRTGAVLALAQEPGYNANAFPQATPGLTIEHAVTDIYEPGSVFKVVTVGGALAEHKVSPSTAFTLPYQIHVANKIIHDAETRPTERMTVAQILQRSSNVGAVTIAERYLGQAGLEKWMARFGFGQKTGIDFPAESAGLLPSYWSGSTIGTVPEGQGVSVTAIQLAAAYGAIANGGEWIQPHLVDHVLGRQPPQLRRRRILPPAIDSELRTMLRGVVSDQGTAQLAAIPGYSVAGKTGTAQKPGGPTGYLPGKYVATFIGMVPASKPRLVVLVSIDEPQGQIYGGLVAAPAFKQIASFDLQYLNVPPDLPLK
jgi:cell division protein FtsI (penicillin-binding protein 3)